MKYDMQNPSQTFIATQALEGERGWRRLSKELPVAATCLTMPLIEDEDISRGLKWCAAVIFRVDNQRGQNLGTAFEDEGAEFYHFLHQQVARGPVLEAGVEDATAFMFAVIATAAVLQVYRESLPDFTLQELAKYMRRVFKIDVQREDVIEEAIRELMPILGEFLSQQCTARCGGQSYLQRAAQAIGEAPRRFDA